MVSCFDFMESSVTIVSCASYTCWFFPQHNLAGCVNISDYFDVHKGTDVIIFVLQQPAVAVCDLIKLTTLDLARITRCVSLKLGTADGKHTCHLQMSVKGVDQLNRKENEGC